jgi:membrane peptidoglycan carboxypeptidase
MDTVKNGLNVPEVEEALAQHGIDNVATSGIRIFTTVDKKLQEKALYSLRKELSRLDARLLGYERQQVQDAYFSIPNNEIRELEPGIFLFGRITDIDLSNGPAIHVSFGETTAVGYIDESGLTPLLDSLIKWQKQRWSEAGNSDLPLILKQLEVGDLVYVSVRKKDTARDAFLLDLEKYPSIQGGLLTMQEGSIRAMVGGMENHFFNRAVSAKRSMGSIMKPLVFAAALQLGWNSVDPLNNNRNVFIYHNRPYFPRPDHLSPHAQVSMNWAGVHSENVATVWLLYHLCDHLTPGQFKDMIAKLGLDRMEGESYQSYMRRIRDDFGIIVNQDALHRAAFKAAVKEVETDLIFAGKLKEYELIKTLHYGVDFDTFLEEVELISGPAYESEARQKKILEKEIELRKTILRKNFLSLMRLRQELRALQDNPLRYNLFEEKTGRMYYNPTTDVYAYTAAGLPTENGWQVVDENDLAAIISRFSTSRFSISRFSSPDTKKPLSDLAAIINRFSSPDTKKPLSEFWDSILIGGILSPATLELLNSYVEKEYNRLAALPPYSEQVLHNLQDFRVTASLHYLIGLAQALGVRSKLDPVLSFPLGSNVISLLETVRIYEGLMSGSQTTFSTNDTDALAIIDRIEDSDGETVYRPTASCKILFTPKTTLAVNNILQNVVRYGTGRFARRNVTLQSLNPEEKRQLAQLDLPVPLFGKTGTANRFTNSAFAGHIPEVSPDGNGLNINSGYTVAAYVGFDDNTPMVRTSTHITGASGALPLWTRFANALLLEKEYSTRLDLVDITFAAASTMGRPSLPLNAPDLGQTRVKVRKDNGLLATAHGHISQQDSPVATVSIVTFGETKENGEFVPSRYFAPYYDEK